MTLLLGGGGLVALVTLQDKKYAAMLENLAQMIQLNAKTNDEWEKLSRYRENQCTELTAEIEKKEAKIEKLYSETARLRSTLDHLRTTNAVNSLMKCTKTKCGERQPPFGAEVKLSDEELKTTNNGNDK